MVNKKKSFPTIVTKLHEKQMVRREIRNDKDNMPILTKRIIKYFFFQKVHMSFQLKLN